MFLALTFPNISPVIVEIGPFALRWYALSYVVGFLLGWRYCLWQRHRLSAAVSRDQLDDFLVWAILGVLLGGRLGYVLVYDPLQYLSDPLEALQVWRGGMSFHGGLVGMLLAMLLFARRRGIALLPLTDLIATAVPIGLFFGRLANFINGELYGRAADLPWAMVFPADPTGLPRHPSQLYEAALEGPVLFTLLLLLSRSARVRQRPGALTGMFLVGYGAARILVEFFREPDVQLGFLAAGSTMGQWLSLPMLVGGLYLILRRRHANPV